MRFFLCSTGVFTVPPDASAALFYALYAFFHTVSVAAVSLFSFFNVSGFVRPAEANSMYVNFLPVIVVRHWVQGGSEGMREAHAPFIRAACCLSEGFTVERGPITFFVHEGNHWISRARR